MSLRSLKIATRSTLCFLLLCLIILTLGLVSLNQAHELNDAEEVVELKSLPSISKLGTLEVAFNNFRTSNARLRNPLEPQKRKDDALNTIIKAQAVVKEETKALRELMSSDVERAALDNLSNAVDRYLAIQKKMLDYIQSGEIEKSLAFSASDLKPAADQVDIEIDALRKLNNDNAAAAGARARSVYSQTIMIVCIVAAVSLLVAILSAWFFTRSILIPINYSLDIAHRIARNELDGAIDVEGKDEPAQLVAALAQMQENLKTIVGHIAHSSNQLAAAGEEVQAVTEDAARGLQQQNQEIDLAATAVTQMSAAVDEVSTNATQASAASTLSNQSAQEGQARVEQTILAINDMLIQVQNSTAEVRQLASLATDISKLLTVISHIA